MKQSQFSDPGYPSEVNWKWAAQGFWGWTRETIIERGVVSSLGEFFLGCMYVGADVCSK